jgi:hypothetical protein
MSDLQQVIRMTRRGDVLLKRNRAPGSENPGRIPVNYATFKLLKSSNKTKVDRTRDIYETHEDEVIVDAVHNRLAEPVRII